VLYDLFNTTALELFMHEQLWRQ